MYPNPNDGSFYLDVNSGSGITVTDILGKIILEEKLIAGKNKIDLRNEPLGIYFVKVVNQNSQSTIKILISK